MKAYENPPAGVGYLYRRKHYPQAPPTIPDVVVTFLLINCCIRCSMWCLWMELSRIKKRLTPSCDISSAMVNSICYSNPQVSKFHLFFQKITHFSEISKKFKNPLCNFALNHSERLYFKLQLDVWSLEGVKKNFVNREKIDFF